MKTNKLFILVAVVLVLLSSCGMDKYADAAKSTAEIFGVQTYSVEVLTTAGSNASKTLSLHLENPRRIAPGYPDFYITSIAGLMFYRNIPVESLNDIGAIDVELVKGNSSYHETYSADDLKKAELLTGRVAEYLDWKAESGLQNVRNLIDSTYISDSSLLAFDANLRQMDVDYGPTTQHTIIGFKNSETAAHEPVLVVYAQAIKAKGQIPFVFYLMKSTGRIIYISTEEE